MCVTRIFQNNKNNVRAMFVALIVGIFFSGCSFENEAGDQKDSFNEVEERPASAKIDGFPIIYQMPELPTGCEITAMTMDLCYYGLPADKEEMAMVYLPRLDSADTYYGDDGILYGNDLGKYFIGDPSSESGIACGAEAITEAANAYLEDCQSELTAVNCTGSTPDDLYELVNDGIPVVVWCTIDMAERSIEEGWYTSDGEYVDWGIYDHGAVLIGYDEKNVIIADPLAGEVTYDKKRFEEVYEERGEQSVILI